MRIPRRIRLLWAGVVLASVLVVAGAYGWRALAARSALTTSYSEVIEHEETLAVSSYEALSGTFFLRGVARGLVAGKAKDRARLEALMAWTHENVRPVYAAPDRLVTDNFFDIVRRGVGFCDQVNHVFAALAHHAGYEAHLLFLHDTDGVSNHSVAEVRVDGRWVIVDAFVDALFVDPVGRLMGVADLTTDATIPRVYHFWERDVRVEPGDFQRATRFETFPYQSTLGLLAKVAGKLTAAVASRLPVWLVRGVAAQGTPDVAAKPSTAAAPGPPPPPPPPPRPPTPRPLGAAARTAAPTTPVVAVVPEPPVTDLAGAVLLMDATRRAHLQGRYRDAIAGYRSLLARPMPRDMRESVEFFIGLASLRAGDTDEAIAVFDAALGARPRHPWRASMLYYRAEARLRKGAVDAAVEDLSAARIAPAIQKLAALGRGYGKGGQ